MEVTSIIANILILVAAIPLLIYIFFLYSYKYWEKRKVPYLPPRFPVGNRRNFLSYTKGYCLELMDLYTEMKQRGWKFGGLYGIADPILMITDPSYMKDILVKDFHYFKDRGFYHSKDDDFTKNVFVMDEEDWKNMRSKLTPTFTSGKMKMMFPLIIKATEGLIGEIEKSVNEKQDIDIKEYLAKFTTDVIVSCALGIDSNCFKDPDNKFRKIGNGLLEPKHKWDCFRYTLMNYAPELCTRMGVKSSNKRIGDFFRNIVRKTLDYRKQNNVVREDFLQLVNNLMESTKDSENPFTFNQLVAQVFIFFLAGYDTSSSAMNFALYELARNPEMQDKLRNEMVTAIEQNGGVLTYELVCNLPYLQQVLDETLRLYPSVPILQRKCVKSYTLRDTDIVIERGIPVVMPIISMQRDPQYFPDPYKFDPDRFSEANRDKIDPTWHLPFGTGPRNCLGGRFGKMQAKVGLIKILTQFEVGLSPNTEVPLHLDEKVFLIKSQETLYLTAKRI